MAQYNARISSFTDNSYLRLRYTVTNVPDSVTISAAQLTIKEGETDSEAVIDKSINSSNAAGTGQIENTGASGTGVLRFDLPPADTALLTPGIQYTYWVDVTLSSGEITTIEKGLIYSQQGSSHS